MRYVIIGGSIAGVSAAQAIRELDREADIKVIAGEKAGPYYRPVIPYLISGQKNEGDIFYREDPLKGNNIESVIGTAIKVDAKKKEVLLASGERFSCDALLLATGSVPLKPPIPGLDGEGVYPLRNMEQAVRIRDFAKTAVSAVVIGGGLVGIKAALALKQQRRVLGTGPRDVTVVEMLPEILNGRLDRQGSRFIRAAVEQEGVAVLTKKNIAKVLRKQGEVSGVKLSSGVTLPADLIIVAAGVRPNISYLKGSGVRTSKGVLVDGALRTNCAGIYAAGDAVEGRELLSKKNAVSGLWGNAIEMGRVAGMNMAGGKVNYPGFLSVMNASEIAGIPFISVGLIEAEGKRYKTTSHSDGKNYWKLAFEGDFLVGAVFVGDLKNAGIYTALIKNRVPIARARDRVEKRTARYVDFLNGNMRGQD